MIRILTDTKLIDLDGWDFPLDEIDYLSEEHDGEVFVISWLLDDDGPRLCETNISGRVATLIEGRMTADEKMWDFYGVLKLYSRLLVNETFSVFGTDEMWTLHYFYERYVELFQQTAKREGPHTELCAAWTELKQEVMDNIENLINGSVGL